MERGLRREAPIIEWNTLIHPDMDAIARRDAFLNQLLARNIQFDEKGITADIDCNICEYPNECENCARAIEDQPI